MWSFRKEIVASDREERKLNDIVALKYSPQQIVTLEEQNKLVLPSIF